MCESSSQTLDTTLSVVCDTPQTLEGTRCVASAATGIHLLQFDFHLTFEFRLPTYQLPITKCENLKQRKFSYAVHQWQITTRRITSFSPILDGIICCCDIHTTRGAAGRAGLLRPLVT